MWKSKTDMSVIYINRFCLHNPSQKHCDQDSPLIAPKPDSAQRFHPLFCEVDICYGHFSPPQPRRTPQPHLKISQRCGKSPSNRFAPTSSFPRTGQKLHLWQVKLTLTSTTAPITWVTFPTLETPAVPPKARAPSIDGERYQQKKMLDE